MDQLQLLIKPVSAACNLRCRYCFYLDESKYWKNTDFGMMDLETAGCLIRRALEEAEECTFAFQGGEPMLAGLSFFRFFTEKAEEYRKPGQRVFYTLQTNGTLLTKEWVEFFKKWRFLLGVSLDGTRKLHDENRTDASGNGSFSGVFKGIRLLQEAAVPFHILCVLTNDHAERIQSIYRFFQNKGLQRQQYIPCLDPIDAKRGKMSYSLTSEKYAQALKTLFDLWYADVLGGNPVYIRQFDNYLSMLLGGQPEACTMYGRCTMQNIVEADGSVYPCDFYVQEKYCVGNVKEDSFSDLAKKAQGSSFFEKAEKRDIRCGDCRWYPLCRGGCRRDCDEMADGSFRNYYCEAYQEFFGYAIRRMEMLAARIERRQF